MGFGVLFGYTGTLLLLFLSPYIVHIKTTYAQRAYSLLILQQHLVLKPPIAKMLHYAMQPKYTDCKPIAASLPMSYNQIG